MTTLSNLPETETPTSEIIFYQPDETIRIEVRMEDDTVWLTQAQMAELFGTNRQAITKHIKNIYNDDELTKNATCSILELVQQEGGRRVTRKVDIYKEDELDSKNNTQNLRIVGVKQKVCFYNLDVIISVGYHVKSQKGINFRRCCKKNYRFTIKIFCFSRNLSYLCHSKNQAKNMNKLTINKVTLGKRLLEVIKNPIIVIYIILLLIWGVVVILSILNPNPSANKLSAILYITLPILYLFLGLKCAEYYITSVCVEDSTITITYLKFNKEYTLTEKLDDIAIDFGVKSKFSLGAGISIQRKISKYDTKNIFLQSYLLDWNKDENIEALKAIFSKK